MAKFACIWLIPLVAAYFPLFDGVTESNIILDPHGTEVLYSFSLNQTYPNKDLMVTLTTFSDTSDPDMYMKDKVPPTVASHRWESVSWGPGAILIKEAELVAKVEYFVLVVCTSPCSYEITYSHVAEVALRLSIPQIAQLAKDREAVFSYKTGGKAHSNLTFTVTPFDPNAQFTVSASTNSLPTDSNSLPVSPNWPFGFECRVLDSQAQTEFKVAVLGLSDFSFMVSVVEDGEALTLLPSNPVRGTAYPGEFTYFRVTVEAGTEVILVKMTTFAGSGSLFTRKGDKPTQTNYDHKSQNFANDTLIMGGRWRQNSEPLEAGIYYIGVYGNALTAFTLYASMNFSSWLPIYPGLPQNDAVMHRAPRYFYMEVPPGHDRNITFRTSPIEGNPNLYVQLCTNQNYRECALTEDMFSNPENHPTLYYSFHREGDDSVYIQHRAADCTANCRYVIAVTGKAMGLSRFVLSGAFDERDEYYLMHAVPVKMTMQRAGYLYFRYLVIDADVSSVVFQVTPLLGDPDLYASRNSSRPSTSDYDRSSVLPGSMIDLVSYHKGGDGLSLVGEYHIAVYSSAQTTFSLVAHEKIPGRNTTILLYPGEPQMATVHNDNDSDYRLFMFEIHLTEENKETITVSLTPVTGSFNLYVANSPQGLDLERGIFTYNWGTDYANHTGTAYSIIITPEDRYYRADSVYLAMVQGKTFAADGTASFIVSYRCSGDIMSLQESFPYTDEVAIDQYKYYTFPINYAHEDVNIQLTAITGDPDLYVLVNTPELPTKTQYHFASLAFGAGETVSIQWEQIREYCPEQPEQPAFGGMGNCYFRIGVYGYSASLYTITVTSRKDMPMLLPLSIPSSGQLNKTLYDYYYTLVSTSVPLSVHLQPIYGDSDLFLNLLDYAASSGNVSDWRRPNKDFTDYKSQSAILADSISIGKEELSEKCKSGSCIVLAGVYCFSQVCKYTITTSQDKIPLVIEGLPTFGQVDSGLYVYYKFYNHQDTAALLFTLMPMNNGDPDLFVSRGAEKRPTAEYCDWSSTSWRGESLLINSSDPHFSDTNSMRGYYTIGVRGYYNVSFSLTVTTNPEPVTQLVAGAPVQADVEPWKARFFSYFNYRQADISVVLTPLYGVAMLRVNCFYIGSADLYDSLPTRYNATWSSTATGYQNRLTITTSSPYYCTGCMFVIGVFADNQSCSFSLSVASGEETMLLQNGIPVQGQVDAQAWRYYAFYLNSRSDLDISVVNYAGDADLYVSRSSTVDPTNAIWKHTTTKHVEHIHIRTSDANYDLGQYTIGVHGIKNTSYAITAHARDSHITLVDGWPQIYSIMYNGRDHLTFEYYVANAMGKDQISCRLQTLSDEFWPSVYIAYRSFSNTTRVPDDPGPKSSAERSYSAEDYDRVYKRLTFELPVPQTLGEYLISVYGRTVGDVVREELGNFEIACYGQGNSTVLLQGHEEYGSLSRSKPRQRFELYVTEPGLLEVSAEPCAGRISMTISTNYTTEENTGNVITVSRVTDGRLQAAIPSAWGQYFVTLKLLNSTDSQEEATFQVSYQFYGQNATRPYKVVPGNDGLLSWEIVDAETVQLTWTAPELEDGTTIEEQALYVVYITNTTRVKMSTVCGMRAGEDSNLAWQSDTANFINATTSPVRLSAGQSQFVNVIAMVLASDGSARLIPYTPTEVFLRSRRPRRIAMWVMGLIAFALVVALGGLLFMWKKYKKVKRTLENEMQDVRNVASITSDHLDSEVGKTQKQTAMYEPLELSQSS